MTGQRMEEIIDAKKARDGQEAADNLLQFGTAFTVIVGYKQAALNGGRTLIGLDAIALSETNRCLVLLAKAAGIKEPEMHAIVSAIYGDVEDLLKEIK